MTEERDGYDRAMQHLIGAMQSAKKSVPNSDFVPALVDFTAMIGLVAEGEAGVRAMMSGMERRMGEWQEGRFPAGGGRVGKKQQTRRRKQTNTVVDFLKAAAEHERTLDDLLGRIEAPARDYVDFVNASPLATTELDDAAREKAYARMEDILADTMQRVNDAGIPLPVLLFSFADFLALLTLRMTGDETVLQMQIERMQGRIADWRAGTFAV